MSDVLGSVKESCRLAIEAFKLLERARDILARGPSSFYFKKLESYVAALFTFSPAQIGDTVEMVEIPDTSGTAWAGYEKTIFLPGSRGIVRELDWRDGHFTFGVVFEREWWIGEDGTEFHTRDDCKHMFTLPQKFVRRVSVQPPNTSGENAGAQAQDRKSGKLASTVNSDSPDSQEG